MSAFTSVPTLDLSLAWDPETKPVFLRSLQQAVIEVGIFYLKSTGIEAALVEQTVDQCHEFFELPVRDKLDIELSKVPNFLGYTRVSSLRDSRMRFFPKTAVGR